MRIIANRTLFKFMLKHPIATPGLLAWKEHVTDCEWDKPGDARKDYNSVSFIKGGRLVFNIGGNDFRLIIGVDYKRHILYLKFFGTHAQYDKIDAATVELDHD